MKLFHCFGGSISSCIWLLAAVRMVAAFREMLRVVAADNVRWRTDRSHDPKSGAHAGLSIDCGRISFQKTPCSCPALEICAIYTWLPGCRRTGRAVAVLKNNAAACQRKVSQLASGIHWLASLHRLAHQEIRQPYNSGPRHFPNLSQLRNHDFCVTRQRHAHELKQRRNRRLH